MTAKNAIKERRIAYVPHMRTYFFTVAEQKAVKGTTALDVLRGKEAINRRYIGEKLDLWKYDRSLYNKAV